MDGPDAEPCRGKADEMLVAAALSGPGLRDLAALAGEILARARPLGLPGSDGGDGPVDGGDTDEASGTAGSARSPPGRATCTTSGTRPTAAPPASPPVY